MTEIADSIQRLGKWLTTNGKTICAAESCTGGLFLSTLTDTSGSSAYVLGGVVTYSNAMKEQLVNVHTETLIAHGAVSPQTAEEMALGVRQLVGADIGVSITGIAGPNGGTAEKPVGLVYIGVATTQGVIVERYLWDGDRASNKLHSVNAAADLVLRAVVS